LWSQDDEHTAYFDLAQELLVEYAEIGLRSRSKRALPRHTDGIIRKLLPVFAPDSEEIPLFSDAATSAYLLASAETWAELDPLFVSRLAHEGWERYRDSGTEPWGSHDRFRASMTLVGLVDNHPSQPVEKSTPSFKPLADYFMKQPSYDRLLHVEAALCTADIAVYGVPPDLEDRYRWNSARAWHLGMSAWVLDEANLLVPK
jgi:hypothetical protein